MSTAPLFSLDHLLQSMLTHKATDLYLTVGAPPSMRMGDTLSHVQPDLLTDDAIEALLSQLLTPDQLDEFYATHEFNTSFAWGETGRFRVNAFRQQSHRGIVIRSISMVIPTLESLTLPPMYGELSLARRGLILIAGPTGAGKTTTLAAIVGHRNTHGQGHIITVEDPIEFIHTHEGCIVTQRDVGLDTYSYAIALKNALRQRPDMIVIGEIRDREVMEQALYFAETSHLCLATIHANNSSQAVERILNFFPEDRHEQLLISLSLNLKAVLSQRLIESVYKKRVLTTEVMLNIGYIRQLIAEGNVREMRELIERGDSDGMHTFDQHLLKLFLAGVISEETALAEADSVSAIRLAIVNEKNKFATSKLRPNSIIPDAEF